MIKKLDDIWQNSFHKIWIFVLEVFFGYPESKYDWRDFSKKTMSKKYDKGQELKRKIIIFDHFSWTKF